jgi:perosamine synthetase
MNELLSIGERYGIPVIEDSAEAIGSSYHGKRAGSIGVFGTFSFHGTKTITTGEGGMFVTNDADLHERVLTLSNHGRARSQKKQFWPDMVGYKYKISNLQAAVGCGQVERIEELTRRKREILQRYKVLEKIAGVKMNPEPEGCINGAWMPTVVFSTDLCITRENLQAAFAKENIDARVFFWPLSSLPMFSEKRENENSWDVADRAINLPSYHDITEDEIDRVINVVYEIQEKRGK